jgi:biotin synthase-related radical SAM superfamily protein
MDSPDHLRLSLAAAMELGFAPGTFHRGARLHCVNLLLTYDPGCRANCAFCGLSRDARKRLGDKNFIRVAWKVFRTDDIIDRLKKVQDRGVVQRVCLSMITHPRAVRDTLALTERLTKDIKLHLSLLIAPTVMTEDDLIALRDAGAERIGVAIDGVTPEIFDRLRGRGVKGPHRWDHYWHIYDRSLYIFGRGMSGVHLICGLGETEREFCGAMARVREMGGFTHLFSFFPERASALHKKPQPPLAVYRRIQLARFLIDHDMIKFADLVFDDQDRIADFGVSPAVLERAIDSGEPFMTSGCPGETLAAACNRPFANERPSQPIRNYPFLPGGADIALCRQQLFDDFRASAQGGLR